MFIDHSLAVHHLALGTQAVFLREKGNFGIAPARPEVV
jgi:hypothetical protein